MRLAQAVVECQRALGGGARLRRSVCGATQQARDLVGVGEAGVCQRE